MLVSGNIPGTGDKAVSRIDLVPDLKEFAV